MDLKNSTPYNTAHYMVYSFQGPFSKSVFVTFGNPAFCLDLYLTGLDFPGELSTLVASVRKISSVDQSELQKYLVSDCQRSYMFKGKSYP